MCYVESWLRMTSYGTMFRQVLPPKYPLLSQESHIGYRKCALSFLAQLKRLSWIRL